VLPSVGSAVGDSEGASKTCDGSAVGSPVDEPLGDPPLGDCVGVRAEGLELGLLEFELNSDGRPVGLDVGFNNNGAELVLG